MTRPVRDPQRSRSGRSTVGKQRSAPGSRAIGQSSLWSDEEVPRAKSQTLNASAQPGPKRPAKKSSAPVPPTRGKGSGKLFGRFGWRSVAIPVLFVLTALVVYQIGQSRGADETTTVAPATVVAPITVVSTAPGSVTTVSAPAGNTAGSAASAPANADAGSTAPDPNGATTDLPSGALPAGGTFVKQGKGTWHVVPGTAPAAGHGPQHYTYSIKVEDGIETAAADQDFAKLVDSTLADSRSWIGSGNYTFQRISTGTPSFSIALTSQLTERRSDMCGWEIKLEASCYARDHQLVSINNARWASGAVSYHGDLADYKLYAINHEVGHALGFGHQPCKVNGGLAPVMMQQSWSVANNDLSPLNPELVPMDGKVCKPNPFPYPITQAASASGTTTHSG